MPKLAELLELERRNRKPEEIKDLNLDNSKATEIEGLTDEYVNLEILSLIHVGLLSLNNFPKLPALKKLEMSDNKISGHLEVLVECCPHLEKLNLTNNSINSIDVLKPLVGLSNLSSLDTFNPTLASIETFRHDVFQLLPQIKYLDGFDRNNQEEPIEYDDDEEEYVECSDEGEEDDDYEEEYEEDATNQSEPQHDKHNELNNHSDADGNEDYDEDDEEEDESQESEPKQTTKRKYPFPDEVADNGTPNE